MSKLIRYTLVLGLLCGGIYVSFAEEASELRAFVARELSQYMDARVYKDGPLTCVYLKEHCFCNQMPESLNGLKVSSLFSIYSEDIRPLTYEEDSICKAMEPSWRVASYWFSDNRPVRYIRSTIHPKDNAAYDDEGMAITIPVGTECKYDARPDKDEEGNTTPQKGRNQWRTVYIGTQMYQAWCESYQTDMYEREIMAYKTPIIIPAFYTTGRIHTDTHGWQLGKKEFAEYMEALPDVGKIIKTNFVGNSPRLDYEVDIAKEGMYYVWVHGVSKNKGSDTMHIGVNAEAVPSASNVSGFGLEPTWSNTHWFDGNSSRTTLVFDNKGIHDINVWMREDGMKFDTIILTLDPDFKPGE